MDGLVWHIGNLWKYAEPARLCLAVAGGSADGIEDLRGDLSSDE